jgi:hypothetical protein
MGRGRTWATACCKGWSRNKKANLVSGHDDASRALKLNFKFCNHPNWSVWQGKAAKESDCNWTLRGLHQPRGKTTKIIAEACECQKQNTHKPPRCFSSSSKPSPGETLIPEKVLNVFDRPTSASAQVPKFSPPEYGRVEAAAAQRTGNTTASASNL